MTRRPSDVTLVIVTHNSEGVIGQCLDALEAGARRVTDGPRIVVVDNASTDGTRELAATREVELVSLERNLGFGAACNRGVAQCATKWVAVLNPDVSIGWSDIGALAERAEEYEEELPVGAVGPRIERPDGTVEPSWERDLTLWRELWRKRQWQKWQGGDPGVLQTLEHDSRQVTSVDWLSGACLLLLREAYEAINGFDEEFFLYFEDADLCRRLREAGYGVRYERSVRAVHLGGQSSGHQEVRDHHVASRRRYYRKWRPLLERLVLRLVR